MLDHFGTSEDSCVSSADPTARHLFWICFVGPEWDIFHGKQVWFWIKVLVNESSGIWPHLLFEANSIFSWRLCGTINVHQCPIHWPWSSLTWQRQYVSRGESKYQGPATVVGVTSGAAQPLKASLVSIKGNHLWNTKLVLVDLSSELICVRSEPDAFCEVDDYVRNGMCIVFFFSNSTTFIWCLCPQCSPIFGIWSKIFWRTDSMECILCASSIKIGNENRSRKRKKSFVVCLVGRSVGLFVCLLVCLFVGLFSFHIVPEFRRKLSRDCSDCSGELVG